VQGAWLAAVAFVAAGLLGCNNLESCGSTAVDITRTDGGLYRCVTAEDCPRTSRVSVCVTDVSSERECVRCDETRCVRLIPESCQ
jgi:hypothetical protein